jgi:hypothetical protein
MGRASAGLWTEPVLYTWLWNDATTSQQDQPPLSLVPLPELEADPRRPCTEPRRWYSLSLWPAECRCNGRGSGSDQGVPVDAAGWRVFAFIVANYSFFPQYPRGGWPESESVSVS